MFYRDQAHDWKKKMEGMDVPSKEFQDNFEWCDNQAENYCNLFINAANEMKKE